MKGMTGMNNCCLWINGKKVSDVQGIKENFNISDVRGYYLGGSLVRWLYSHNAVREAQLVESIPTGINPDKMLFDIFCTEYKKPDYHKGVCCAGVNAAGLSRGSYRTSFSSLSGSYKGFAMSFRPTSAGSYRYSHEYEYEFETNSFKRTSFRIGSFGGSYLYGSFAGSWINGYGSYDIYGSFTEKQLSIYFTSEPLNYYGYGINLI